MPGIIKNKSAYDLGHGAGYAEFLNGESPRYFYENGKLVRETGFGNSIILVSKEIERYALGYIQGYKQAEQDSLLV